MSMSRYWSGSGTWNTTNANWSTITGGPYTGSWPSGGDAVFEQTAGTVALGSAYPTANSLTFTTTGYSIAGGTLTLAGRSVTTGSGINATISSVIAGSAGLTKLGTGGLTLTGANIYTGTTTVTRRTLSLGDGTTNGSVASTSIVDGAMLAFNNASDQTYSGTISGGGSLIKSGAGRLILTGNNTYNGTTTINAGTVRVGNTGITGTLGTGNVVINSGNLAFYRTDDITVNNAISGAGNVYQMTSAALTLSGARHV